jgi:hypothetical protein
MGKKTKSNIYENEQVNRKHRKKSKKLEKREKHKKSKKAQKKENHQRRKLEKYIRKTFKDNKKEIDLGRLPLDWDELTKQVRKLIELDQSSLEEVPDLFKMMEDDTKEVDLSSLENKSAQKYIIKIMKHLKVWQNPKNPYAFKIIKREKNARLKYTTDVEDVISDTLSSYYLLVRSMFEYTNFIINNPEDEKSSECEDKAAEQDEESEELDEKFGNNAELINKAFHKIMQEEPVVHEEEETELVGPPVPDFLKATMSLIGGGDSLDDMLSKNTYTHSKPDPRKKVQPTNVQCVNKDSYDKIISYDRERMKYIQEHLDEYESEHRGTSLLELHQKKKSKNSDTNPMLRPFDRNKDLNMVDNKGALKLISESKGLKGRFESKEKYIGY